MSATVPCNAASNASSCRAAVSLVDPVDFDRPEDEEVITSRRGLCRLATVAAEAGARFQRDGTGIDPVAWMLAPRRMFGGATPLDACLERESFLRGVLVHGLTLDLDMGLDAVDDLLADNDGEEVTETEARRASQHAAVIEPRLFSATLACRERGRTRHAFHAALASDRAAFERSIARRFGRDGRDAIVRAGIDPGDPMTEALVSPTILHMLTLIEADPTSPLAAGLDVSVEQAFID